MDAAGVLLSFTGIAVHDAWAPYDCYPAATHALCNAHLLRELVAVTEQAGVDESGWCWAEQVRTALLELKAAVEQARTLGASGLDPALLAWYAGHIRSAALIAANAARRPGDPVGARHRALAHPGSPSRLPEIRHRFPGPIRQQRRRTRDTHGAAAGEGLRLSANPGRRGGLRRDPFLFGYSGQTRHRLPPYPDRTHSRPSLVARIT